MEDVRRLPVGEETEGRVTLDDLAREGALRMIAAALEAEVDEYVRSFAEECACHGRIGQSNRRLCFSLESRGIGQLLGCPVSHLLRSIQCR
jgi:hypothetical protein